MSDTHATIEETRELVLAHIRKATRFVLASVVIDADDKRTTYVQTIESLDDGPFNNETAIEIPGNGVVMAGDKDFYLGLAEEPTYLSFSSSTMQIRCATSS